jgi:hypothetical protein
MSMWISKWIPMKTARQDVEESWSQCWVVLTRILGFEIGSHNENQLVSHFMTNTCHPSEKKVIENQLF